MNPSIRHLFTALTILLSKLAIVVQLIGWEYCLAVFVGFVVTVILIGLLLYKAKAISVAVLTYLLHTATVITACWIVHQGYTTLRSVIDFTDLDDSFQFASARLFDYIHNITEQISEIETSRQQYGSTVFR